MSNSESRDVLIQSRLDSGLPVEQSADAEAYQVLYRELGRSDAHLSASFASSVMEKLVERRLAAGESVSSLVSIGVSVVALGGACVVLAILSALGYGGNLAWLNFDWVGAVPATSVMAAISLLVLCLFDVIMSRGGLRPTLRYR